MKKVIIPAILVILYLIFRVASSNYNWFDIGINDPLNNHTINILHGSLQIVPWDVIIDLSGTLAIVLVLLYIFIVGGKNFLEGYRGQKTSLGKLDAKKKEIIDTDLQEVLNGNMDVEEYDKREKKKERLTIFGIILWFIGGVIFTYALNFLGGYTYGEGYYSFSITIYFVITVIVYYYIVKRKSRQENKNKNT